MKGQWGLIIGLVVMLIIAFFSVINMDIVSVNYVFGTAQWPLVMVIISSVLMGGILVGVVNVYGIFKLKSHLKKLQLENEDLQKKLAESRKYQINHKKKTQDNPNSTIPANLPNRVSSKK